MLKACNSLQGKSYSQTVITVIVFVALGYGFFFTFPALAGPTSFVDINPDISGPLVRSDLDCPEDCASGGSGGRVNGLSGVPEDPFTYFAASEVGGLFKSIDGGDSWFHLDGYLPTRTWDVASPDGMKVYATSLYDGREESLAGVEVSDDGGLTWKRPNIIPPTTCLRQRRDQPSAFGISIRPDAPYEVLVGTNCGIQMSIDSGNTWTAGVGVGSAVVWDVVALSGGNTYYACGEDGFFSSTDGQNWNWLSRPQGTNSNYKFCRLAVSPDEPYVVFAVFATVGFSDYMVARSGKFFESDDGGNTWRDIPCLGGDDCDFPKRNPFLVTNKRTDGFDLWLGGAHLFRVPCTTPTNPVPGGSRRCTDDTTQWIGTFTDARDRNGISSIWKTHGDSGDLVFDSTASVDACPTLYSSDGGIYKNVNTESPKCHDQVPANERATFKPANVGLHSQLLLGMAGVHRSGIEEEDIYMVTQDIGVFYTGNAGAAKPVWTHIVGGDSNDIVADELRVVEQTFTLKWYNAWDLANPQEIFNNATCVSHGVSDVIDQYGTDQYVVGLRDASCTGYDIGVQLISDFTQSNLGEPLGGPDHTYLMDGGTQGICHVRTSKGPTDTNVYALAGVCGWNGSAQANELWRFSTGRWTQVNPPAPGTGLSFFAVDPVNPLRLYASVVIPQSGVTPEHVDMYRSTTGGGQWDFDERLTDLMYGVRGGRRTFRPLIQDAQDGAQSGPTYQATFVAFDPENSNILMAGGRESGVFISSDGGNTWALLTDPFTPGISKIPHLPRPFWAHFDHKPLNSTSVYIGTVGRGVWRIDLANADLSLSKTCTPDLVTIGEDLTYTVQATNNGPDPAFNVTIEDELPTGLTFQSTQVPSGWSVDAPEIGTGGTMRFTTPSMEMGTAIFTIVLHVGLETPPGPLSNSAEVFSAAIDEDPSDNVTNTIVTVNQPPVAVCKDVAVSADEMCEAYASIDDGSFDPDGDPVTIAESPEGPYRIGTTVVTLTITDSVGANSSCSGTVTVIDTTPPVIEYVTARPNILWPPNHKMVPIYVNSPAYDNCDPNPACNISSVSSNESENGLGDGDTYPDWEILGGHIVNLRAERSGGGEGRIYNLEVTCTDFSGNSSTDTVSVKVPHDSRYPSDRRSTSTN